MRIARSRAILMTAAVFSLSTGCGGSPVPRLDAKTSGAPSVPVQSPAPTTTATATDARFTDRATARKQFASGLAAYCTRFYVDQRNADEKYPGQDRASEIAFDKTMTEMVLRTGRMLDKLQPPTELAQTFSKFVANARAIYDARVAISAAVVAGDPAGGASADLDAAGAARHPLGKALQAARCDGQLPAGQRTAVIALAKTFDMTTDPEQGCVALVTPEFLKTQWADQADPMAACVADKRSRQRFPKKVATNIKVGEVTGVDGLTATVHFAEVGGCCAGQATVARLYYFVDGSWKIRSMSYE